MFILAYYMAFRLFKLSYHKRNCHIIIYHPLPFQLKIINSYQCMPHGWFAIVKMSIHI